ncbi:SDR family oxidoreductase [Gryllotalpicola ginsengisoli]|uniref:SDR family oxidoreductase n=1 Tax=Gryllotalpicola ginsengisoli TaxID=444608 RepID=UPI0003B4F385|nr:SDR family oxidoreductase [Gryllotalpicola ginsengisoli]
MDLGYNGKLVLVAGGTGLIGSAVRARLEAEGATVVPASRHPQEGGVALDARDDASARAAVEQVLDRYGRIDALVVAAAPPAQTLPKVTVGEASDLADAVDGKALGFVRVANAVVPAMTDAGYGRIVAVCGQIGYLTGNLAAGLRNAALLVAAKHLADALAGTGVTVNVVNPGPVRDDASTAAPERLVPGDSTPAQVADLIAFLASPLAGAISGESISIGHKLRGVTAL